MRVSTTLAAILLATLAVAGPAAAGPALLFDASDGKILYAEEMDDQWHPASLTKIMTAYMAFKAIKAGKIRLDDKVICTQLANQQPPSKIGLPIGGELTVELALQALIVKSANDVAVMLAEKISGSELQFVADMNATARELGMTRTQFSNANGLPAFGQVTTARDLAKLARAVSAEFPEYSPYWAMTQMRIGKIRLSSSSATVALTWSPAPPVTAAA
jgi:D-alanyl-D-alanine carboxypeptidase